MAATRLERLSDRIATAARRSLKDGAAQPEAAPPAFVVHVA
jgi:hypothetical protein